MEKQIRKRETYKMWERLYEALTTLPLDKQMEAVHQLIDEKRGYHYNSQSMYAEESLNLFLKDKGLKA